MADEKELKEEELEDAVGGSDKEVRKKALIGL